MAKDSFSDMWELLTTEDSKPPLYYLYLKFILFLFPKKYEIFGAHFASFLLLILAQIFAFISVKKDYGDKKHGRCKKDSNGPSRELLKQKKYSR